MASETWVLRFGAFVMKVLDFLSVAILGGSLGDDVLEYQQMLSNMDFYVVWILWSPLCAHCSLFYIPLASQASSPFHERPISFP